MRRLVVLLLLLTACADAGAPAADRAAPGPTATVDRPVVTLRGPDGRELRIPVEVAADPAARRQGLMGRQDLPDGTGMVFLFPEDGTGPFWMKDTLMPLTIAFASADGDLVAVLDMEPCAAEPCATYHPGVPYRTALEVEQGLLAEKGVDERWSLELPPGLPDPS